MHGSQNFAYDAHYLRMQHRPGWSAEFRDFDYRVESDGAASVSGQTGVDLVASRLFKIGY